MPDEDITNDTFMSNPLSISIKPRSLSECSRGRNPQQGRPNVTGNAVNNHIQAVYIHVPFCLHKCHYCDFYSIVERPDGPVDRQEAFVKALIKELKFKTRRFNARPQTIFIGGGTPTLLRPTLWNRLLDAAVNSGLLEQAQEITVEANPETITPELLEVLVAGGVNRISMGAQSFHPQLLKALERRHRPESVKQAIRIVRSAGIENINLDLMFAITGQTIDMLETDLSITIDLGPTHISCYNLTFEPNTPLAEKLRQGLIQPLPEQIQRKMFEHALARLDQAGFEHYEISNWARRQTSNATNTPSPYRCGHNLTYWHNGNWLGLGPSAASHVHAKRWKNEPHIGRYLKQSPKPTSLEVEELPSHRQIGEHLMLGLRLVEGLRLDWLSENLPSNDPRQQIIEELVELDILQRTETHLCLTRSGLFVADTVIAKLL